VVYVNNFLGRTGSTVPCLHGNVLFAQSNQKNGDCNWSDNLGIDLAADPEEILANLQETKTYQEKGRCNFPDKTRLVLMVWLKMLTISWR